MLHRVWVNFLQKKTTETSPHPTSHARHFLKKAKMLKTCVRIAFFWFYSKNRLMNDEKIIFKLPKYIKYKEARKVICNIVRQLNDAGVLTPADIPQLHRMATAYDCYLDCVRVISEKGMVMVNLKGETVKRPEANLLRESWSQYLEIAKEYGLTTKSKGQIRAFHIEEEESPLDKFVKGKKEIR